MIMTEPEDTLTDKVKQRKDKGTSLLRESANISLTCLQLRRVPVRRKCK